MRRSAAARCNGASRHVIDQGSRIQGSRANRSRYTGVVDGANVSTYDGARQPLLLFLVAQQGQRLYGVLPILALRVRLRRERTSNCLCGSVAAGWCQSRLYPRSRPGRRFMPSLSGVPHVVSKLERPSMLVDHFEGQTGHGCTVESVVYLRYADPTRAVFPGRVPSYGASRLGIKGPPVCKAHSSAAA